MRTAGLAPGSTDRIAAAEPPRRDDSNPARCVSVALPPWGQVESQHDPSLIWHMHVMVHVHPSRW